MATAVARVGRRTRWCLAAVGEVLLLSHCGRSSHQSHHEAARHAQRQRQRQVRPPRRLRRAQAV